jgi:hypothetical protein
MKRENLFREDRKFVLYKMHKKINNVYKRYDKAFDAICYVKDFALNGLFWQLMNCT